MDQKSLQPARPMDSLLRTPQHPRRRPPGSQRWPQSLRDYCLLSIGQVEHYSGASQDDYLRDSIAWATSAMWKGCAVPYLSYEFVQECEIFGLSFRLPIPRSASCPARLYRLSKFGDFSQSQQNHTASRPNWEFHASLYSLCCYTAILAMVVSSNKQWILFWLHCFTSFPYNG